HLPSYPCGRTKATAWPNRRQHDGRVSTTLVALEDGRLAPIESATAAACGFCSYHGKSELLRGIWLFPHRKSELLRGIWSFLHGKRELLQGIWLFPQEKRIPVWDFVFPHFGTLQAFGCAIRERSCSGSERL